MCILHGHCACRKLDGQALTSIEEGAARIASHAMLRLGSTPIRDTGLQAAGAVGAYVQ